MIRLAIIGLGHWGPNYLRNFSQEKNCCLVACLDANAERIKLFQDKYPSVHFYTDLDSMLAKESLDAAVLVTPTSTHFDLAQICLKKNLHILIEKPFALIPEQCVALGALAQERKKILMVGHTFLYNGAVNWMKRFFEAGSAGRIYYLHAARTNLGPIRQDVNALYDLAPHDISIFLYLLGLKPKAVSAQGAAFFNQNEDVVFLTLYFENKIMAHIHVSWLDPCKVRKITVIAEKQMLVFDDIDVAEPIRIYNKGVKPPKDIMDFSQFKAVVYDGDIVIPKIPLDEPLKIQCQEFLKCVVENKTPLSDARFGTAVVHILNKATESLRSNGAIVAL